MWFGVPNSYGARGLDGLQLDGSYQPFEQDLCVRDGDDTRIWEPNLHVNFSLKSMCRRLLWSGASPRVNPNIWKGDAAIRIKVFGWLAGMYKILTIDHLRNHRMVIVNACPFA